MTNLKIKKEFAHLITPLSEDERQALEESILTHGCRDAIKVWRGIVLDGHNRFAICLKHKLPFKVTMISLANKEAAILWIIDNQLGRRNLPKAARIKLAMHKAQIIQKTAHENRSLKGCKPVHVRKNIAATASVSERTVQKYMQLTKEADAETLNQVDIGKQTIGEAHRKLTVRNVEVWYDSQSPQFHNHPISRSNALSYIGTLESLYSFIRGQDWYVRSWPDAANILNMAVPHYGTLLRIIEKFELKGGVAL